VSRAADRRVLVLAILVAAIAIERGARATPEVDPGGRPPGSMQLRRPPQPSGSVRFVALLDCYRRGNADEAVETLSKWKEKELQSEAIIPAGNDDPASREAFVALLTEAGIRNNNFARYREGTHTFVFLGGWGLEDVFEPLSYRAFLQIKELTQWARSHHDGAVLDFCRNWYVLTISFTLRWDRRDAESGLWDIADHEFRDDPEMHVLLGSVGEARAGPLQPTMQFDCPWPDWYHGTHGCLLTSMLQEARWGFRGALKDDPPPLEARLRLGRILHLVGQDEESRELLDQALAEAKATHHLFVTYMAGLFLGELDEEAGHLTDAIEHYRDAVAANPTAHTGRLALGQALVRSGDNDGWIEVRAMFDGEGPDHPAAEDPWAIYASAQFWQQADRLRVMREAARR